MAGVSLKLISAQMMIDLLLAQLVPFSATNTEDIEYYPVNTSQSRRETVIDITDYGCGARTFCNSSLAKYENEHCYSCKKCNCDQLCSFYGDCCPDRLFDQATDLPTPPSPHITCQQHHIKSKNPFGNKYSFMVSSCPNDSTVDPLIRYRCEQFSGSTVSESTPVTVISTQVTYINVYCAMCHHQSGYTKWRLEVKCGRTDFLSSAKDKDELWYYVLNDSSCYINRSPPKETLTRTCYYGLVDQCSTSGIWENPNERIAELCLRYYSPVRTGSKEFRNIFCSICNGVKLSRQKTCSDGNIVIPRQIPAPLSVLIDFNPKPSLLSPPNVEISRPKCNDTELFDPISESCRVAQCSSGRVLTGGQCELVLETLAGVGYSGSLALKVSEYLSSTQWIQLLEQYNNNLRASLQHYNPFILSKMIQTVYTFPHIDEGEPTLTKNISGTLLNFDFLSTSDSHIVDFEEKFRNLHSHVSNFTIDGKTGTVMSTPVPCLSNVKEILEGQPDNVLRTGDPPFFSQCELGFCDFSAVIYRPILDILNCSHLEYRLTEFNITFIAENSSLIIDDQTIELQESKYWICNDVIKICSSELGRIEQLIRKPSHNGTIPTEVSPAMSIVSLVCMVLSLVSLLLTFIVYCLLPQLRTLPGKNTMVLVVYLFLAQLFFLIGIRLIDNISLCRTMGVVIHYLWIATFVIMSTCAFHMFTVFAQLSSKAFHNRLEERSTLIRYIIITNVISALVIGVCIGYHAGMSNGAEIGYGGAICFLNSPLDIGVFFAAPLGIVLVFNTFCFIRVALSIRQVPNMNTVKNQANKTHAATYFRLSVLLGFTWIFGFIATISQLDALWYIFLILNGLQGLFIFLAYCLNKRTLIMVKARCYKDKPNKYGVNPPLNSPVASTETSSL